MGFGLLFSQPFPSLSPVEEEFISPSLDGLAALQSAVKDRRIAMDGFVQDLCLIFTIEVNRLKVLSCLYHHL